MIILSPQKISIDKIELRILVIWRQTSWLFISMSKELNLGLLRTIQLVLARAGLEHRAYGLQV